MMTWLISGLVAVLPSVGLYVYAAVKNDYAVKSEVLVTPVEVIAFLQTFLVVVVVVFYIKIYKKVNYFMFTEERNILLRILKSISFHHFYRILSDSP